MSRPESGWLPLHRTPADLVELQYGDAAPSYVAGASNFHAATRYIWSSYHAMAVIELEQAVRRVYRAGP